MSAISRSIELFRCGVERFVPIVQRQFAGGNRRLKRLAFFVAFLRIRLAADFLCLVIIEEIESRFGERNALYRNLQVVGAEPIKRRGAHLGITIIELRIHSVPEVLDERSE